MPYKLRKAPKRDLYWVVGPDGKKHSKDPIAKDKAEAQKRVLDAAMGVEAPKRKTPKRGKGKGETIKVTNPMGSRKAEKAAREKAELEAYARKHEKELAELGISPNSSAPKERHPSEALFEPVLADCFSGVGEACRALGETLGLVKPRRGRGKKLKGGGLAEKIAALKEHVRSQYREGLGPTESPKFVDVAMAHLPFESYEYLLRQQSKRLSSARIPLEELETGYVRRINELAHEYAADMASKHLHPSQYARYDKTSHPGPQGYGPDATQLQYRRSHPIAFGPVTFVATAKPEPKPQTTEGVTKQYLLERAAAMLPWSLARSKEINEGLLRDPNPDKGRPKDLTYPGRFNRLVEGRPTRNPSQFAEEGEFGPLPESAAQEPEGKLGRIFSAAEVTDTVARSKALEGRMSAALARLGAADDELEGNGKLSGSGPYTDSARAVFAQIVGDKRLKPADRRRVENMLDRAVKKLGKERSTRIDEYPTMDDIQSRLHQYRTVELPYFQRIARRGNDRARFELATIEQSIHELERAINSRHNKERIIEQLKNDLNTFLGNDPAADIRTIPAGESTAVLMEDIENGMPMVDLDRAFYNEAPTYFSKAELDRWNTQRVAQGLPAVNPSTNVAPRSVDHYFAHVEGEPRPAGTRAIKTTRMYGPFTKYILNPLKHLFVKPREEDVVNIQPGQTAEEIDPDDEIQIVENPLNGRGLSGGGHFKSTAKGIFARLVAARSLKPADRRRAENMLERALHELSLIDDSNVFEVRTMADLQARLQHYRGVMARWQNATPQYRDRNFTMGIWAQIKIEETEKLIDLRQKKQNIVDKLQSDLTTFLTTSSPTVRTIPAGQSTTLLMDDIVNGMEMTDLDRMYYNENPTYFSRAELEQYNATRAQQGLGPQNPTNRGVPQSVHHYLAHVEGEEPPTAPRTSTAPSSINTTRRFGPFTKYILNPLKHLFVKPREEDFVNIRQGQTAVEDRVGPAVAIQTVNNPLLGRGVSGGGPFKKKAREIYKQITEGFPFTPQDRRRAQNILDRALMKLKGEFAATTEFPDRDEVEYNAAWREEYLRNWRYQPPSIRNNREYLYILNVMEDNAKRFRRYQQAYEVKEGILRKLKDDLNAFVMGDNARVRRIPAGQQTSIDLEPITNGMEMTDLDRMYSRPSPTYFSKAEVERYNAFRRRMGAEPLNPNTRLPPRSTYNYLAHVEGYPRPPLPATSAVDTTRAFTPFMKYIFNPLKHLFVEPREEDFVPIPPGQTADASAVPSAIVPVTQTNPLYGRGGSWFDIFRPSRVINEVTNPDSILRRRITDVSKGVRKGYSPSARKTIEAYGSWIIDMIVVRRVPVQAALHTAFELVTLGKWNAARAETNKDRLFHLSIVVRLRKGGGGVPAYVIVEKNEVVNIGPTKPRVDNAEEIRVQSPNISLEAFLTKALEANPERFFPYDAFQNNCQDFVMMVLGANGLLNNDVTAFVKQPIGDLLAKVPGWTGPVANVITDVAGIANVALEGAGKGAFAAQLKRAGISPSAYLREVKRRAKKHQYPKVEFATDGDHKLSATDKNGKVTSFGKVGYGDHIIYSHLEAVGKVPAGTAAMKQSVFHKSHSKIKGDWKKDAYSANNLALRILW